MSIFSDTDRCYHYSLGAIYQKDSRWVYPDTLCDRYSGDGSSTGAKRLVTCPECLEVLNSGKRFRSSYKHAVRLGLIPPTWRPPT